jgi:hypothetical protein
MGEEAGEDVGEEHRAQRQQDVLHTMEARPEDEHADRDRRDRDADERCHPGQAEGRGDACELRAGRADVGQHERHQEGVRPARSVTFADQRA